jgi:hypothetical protein
VGALKVKKWLHKDAIGIANMNTMKFQTYYKKSFKKKSN